MLRDFQEINQAGKPPMKECSFIIEYSLIVIIHYTYVFKMDIVGPILNSGITLNRGTEVVCADENQLF